VTGRSSVIIPSQLLDEFHSQNSNDAVNVQKANNSWGLNVDIATLLCQAALKVSLSLCIFSFPLTTIISNLKYPVDREMDLKCFLLFD
jgi:hypothetical protein